MAAIAEVVSVLATVGSAFEKMDPKLNPLSDAGSSGGVTGSCPTNVCKLGVNVIGV
jgi:hypothetical protein